MTLSELNELIQRQLAGNTFFITQADLPSAAVEKLFRDFVPDRRLDLSFATVEVQSTETVVHGTMQQKFLEVEDLRATLTFGITNNAPTFKMEVSNFPSDWTFAKSFPRFQDSVLNELTYFQPSFTLDSQVSQPLEEDFQVDWGFKPDRTSIESNIFRGLAFSAQLALRDLPASFSWLTPFSDTEEGGPLQSLTIAGPLEIRDGIPKFWFKTQEPWDFNLIVAEIPLQLNLISLLPENESFRSDEVPITFARLSTHLDTTLNGAPFVVPLDANFSSMRTLLVNLESDLSQNAQPLLLADVPGLIGIPASEGSLLPAGFPTLENLSLERLGFDLNTSTRSLSSIYARIGTSSELSFLNDSIRLVDLQAQFMMHFDQESDPTPGLTLFLKAAFHEHVLQGYLTLPEMSLGCSLPPGETIDLKRLIEVQLNAPFDMPEVMCTDLTLDANLEEKTFDFAGTIEQDWSMDLGGETISFKKLSLEFSRGPAEDDLFEDELDATPVPVPESSYVNTGRIYGELTVGDILFFASAGLQSAEEGWILEGGNYEGEIPISHLIAQFSQVFGASFLLPVPELTISNLNLTFKQKSKDFSLVATVKTDEPLTIGPASFDVTTYVNLSSETNSDTQAKTFSGELESRIFIGDALFTLKYEFGEDKIITGTWQSTDGEEFELADLISFLGFEELQTLPVEAHFSRASFRYVANQSDFTLSAVSSQFGEAEFRAFQDLNQKWSFEFGMKLGALEGIPGIGDELALVGDVIKEVSLKVASPANDKPMRVGLDVGFGLPPHLNNLFGVDQNDEPLYQVFKTYDPQNPGYSIIDTEFTRDENGMGFRLLDSPLRSVELEEEGGESWLPFDLGDFGAGRIRAPRFSYNEVARSFLAAGGFDITRPLSIPFSPVRNLMDEVGLGFLKDSVPEKLSLESYSFLDSSGHLKLEEMGVPSALLPILQPINNLVPHLPDRFKSYLEFTVPDRFSFEISYGQGLGNMVVKLSVPENDPPIKVLFFAGAGFIGLELRSFSLGEVLRGKMMVLEVDAKVDFFDPLTLLAAALIPGDLGGLVPEGSDLQKTIVARNLFAVIPISTGSPVPIPLFFDELSFQYLGFEGFELGSEFRFPKPGSGTAALTALLTDLFAFLTDRNYLLDPDSPPGGNPMEFTIGGNYLQLPQYLSGYTLGEREDIATLPTYSYVAHLLNWLKTFRISELIESIPIDYRVNQFNFSFSFLSFNAAWLVTSPREFRAGAYQRIQLSAADAEEALSNLPAPILQAGVPVGTPDPEDGMVVFLKGGIDLGFLELEAVYGFTASTTSGFGSAFRFQGELLEFIDLDFTGRSRINPQPTDGKFLSMGGDTSLSVAGHEIVQGEFEVTNNSFDISAQIDVFPNRFPVQIEGEASGSLSNSEFRLEGNAAVKVGSLSLFTGAAEISDSGFFVRGSWLGLSLGLELSSSGSGVEATGSMGFDFEVDLDITGLGGIMGNVPGLSSAADLSNIEVGADLSMTLGSSGFQLGVSGHFELSGQRLAFPSFTLSVVPSDLEEIAEEIAERIAGVIGSIPGLFVGLIMDFAEDIVGGVEVAADAAVNAANAAYDEAADIVNGAQDLAEDLVDSAEDFAGDVAGEVADIAGDIGNVVGQIGQTQDAINTATTATVGAINSGIGVVSGAANNIASQGASIFRSAANILNVFNPFSW